MAKKLTDKQRAEKARKRRLALAIDKTAEKKEDTSKAREDFRKHFAKIKKKLKLGKDLEEIIWTHLKAIKCDKQELFDKGIKHFGYDV